MNLTAYLPVLILFSSKSLSAGMASTKSTAKAAGAEGQRLGNELVADRVFQPVRRKRAKKLEKAL